MKADLGAHEDEAKGIDSSHQGIEDPAVPALVGLVVQSVDSIAGHQRVQHIAQVSDGIGIVLLRLAGVVVAWKGTKAVLRARKQC